MRYNAGMFKDISQINLAELRKNYARLYYFGLGFIQLKIDETYRLHFYSPELPAITEDIHNHRYNFESTILKGHFVNRIYTIDEHDEGGYIMVNESCNPNISAPKLDKSCDVRMTFVGMYRTGQSYHMPDTAFHTVRAEDCITLLKRGDYTKEYAQIILPKEKPSVCPFSKKIPEEELWKLMQAML